MDEKFFSTEKGEITIIFNEFQIPFVSIDELSFVIEFLTNKQTERVREKITTTKKKNEENIMYIVEL